ncbi:MAG: hypothetical protein ABJN95_16105, partial [Maribacter sp.]|uniref:hypothetical protein n=1 Tax=Maribacter sp. TaxID=1897614 RepID=UPI00329A4B62
MGNFTFYSFHVFKCAFLSKRTKRAIGLLAFCLPILTYGQTPCAPISTLDCDDIAVVLPYSLDFSASTPNTLADAAVNGTGFTMSLDHSEARRSSDLPISNPLANGYEPSLLSLGGGSLQLLSQGGIAYLDPPASNNNNNQVNTLGVGITDMASSFIVKSTLLNIVTGGGGA